MSLSSRPPQGPFDDLPLPRLHRPVTRRLDRLRWEPTVTQPGKGWEPHDGIEHRGDTMSTNDKAKHTAQKAAGGTKETLGKITGNERLKAEGKAESTKASVKKAGDHLKDAAK